MTIDEYAAWAATLGKEPLRADKEMLSYLGLGLADSETSDLVNYLKSL